MKYLTFCIFSTALVTAATSWAGTDSAPIEIIIGGKKYDSLETYQKEQRNQPLPDNEPKGAKPKDNLPEVEAMFDQTVKSAKSPLDLKFDPSKMKTIYIEPKNSLDPSAETAPTKAKEIIIKPEPPNASYTAINEYGVDKGVRDEVSDYSQSPKSPDAVIKADDLEHVLRDSYGDSQDPLMMISDKKSLRVLELQNADSDTR